MAISQPTIVFLKAVLGGVRVSNSDPKNSGLKNMKVYFSHLTAISLLISGEWVSAAPWIHVGIPVPFILLLPQPLGRGCSLHGSAQSRLLHDSEDWGVSKALPMSEGPCLGSNPYLCCLHPLLRSSHVATPDPKEGWDVAPSWVAM